MKRTLVFLAVAIAFLATRTDAATRPNVLFVMSDDLCNAVGTYGHPLVKTPNLDRLAARGVKFERAYCQYPLCNPSRTSLLTGRRPNVTHVLGNGPRFREFIPDTVTLPELFKNNGYFVARVGKLYHYGVPTQIGTDGLDDPQSWMQVVNPKGRDKDDEPDIFTLKPGQYGGTLSWLAAEGTDAEQTDGIGAAACIKLLEEHKDKPFFIAMGFYRPHTPYVAPKKYFDMYPLSKIPVPFVPKDHWKTEPAAAFMSYKAEQDQLTDDLRRQAIQAYHASTTFMDAQLGQVLDALDRFKLTDRTIVVFVSDHGYHLGEHGLWQKMSLFENSARVPLVIASPGALANGKSAAAPVELVDIYPTLADLCGLKAPDYLAGKTLRPILNDPVKAVKPGAFTQVQRGGFPGYSVSNGRYRYIEWDGGKEGVQLYDVVADPQELKDLAKEPAHAETMARLKKLIVENWPTGTWTPETKAKKKNNKKKENK